MRDPEATIALVTGASRGIGAATVLALARAGLKVAAGYRSDAEGAEEVVAKATAEGAEAMAVPIEVRDETSVDRAFRQVEEAFGPVRVLVNNAGFIRDGLAVRYALEWWDTTVETNLRGAFLCSRRALAGMLRARWGRIVNVSSVAALRGNAGQTAYSASKAGLIGLTRSLAREVGSRGITVNAVCPGFVETRMTEEQSDETRQRYIDLTPAGRFGTPEEIAAVIAFLCRPEASYVNGAVIAVDGGLTA
ncbi:MAG TPA: 3-oxoacyl-ACP reductase family protein [Actinomycetota bacterium]|nr:3-oxoacyl-ACP reductase family protein [Actinomycetota bacterium]